MFDQGGCNEPNPNGEDPRPEWFTFDETGQGEFHFEELETINPPAPLRPYTDVERARHMQAVHLTDAMREFTQGKLRWEMVELAIFRVWDDGYAAGSQMVAR